MKVTRAISLALLAASTSACASFTERPEVPPSPGRVKQVAVRLSRSWEGMLQFGSTEWIRMPIATGLDQSAADAIWRSGWIRRQYGDEPAYELRVHVAEYQGRGPALLSTLTGFLIPDAVDHRIELQLYLEAPDSTGATCTRSAEVRTWVQTFLIVVYPFKSPAFTRIKATEALALQCASELFSSRVHGD